MDTARDDNRDADRSVRRTHSTTIVLEEQEDSEWLATQGGVPVEGHGKTAAEAVAEYCRILAEDDS